LLKVPNEKSFALKMDYRLEESWIRLIKSIQGPLFPTNFLDLDSDPIPELPITSKQSDLIPRKLLESSDSCQRLLSEGILFKFLQTPISGGSIRIKFRQQTRFKTVLNLRFLDFFQENYISQESKFNQVTFGASNY